MGANMFSNGREMYVGTSSANVFAEYEDPTKQLMIAAIKTGSSISDTFKEAYTLQISKRCKTLYKKAASTVFKYPVETLTSSMLSNQVEDYLENIMGTNKFSVRVEEDTDYIKNIVETILVNTYGWDESTDLITTPPVAMPAVDQLAHYKVDLSANAIHFTFIGNGCTHTQKHDVVTDMSIGAVLYCTAKDKPDYTYVYGSGVQILNHAIKNIFLVIRGSESSKGNYLPVIPIYVDDFEIGAVSNSADPRYIDGRRLFKTIGMDYEESVTQLKESVTEHIGDHKGLYAYMMFGVDPMRGVFKQTGVLGTLGIHTELADPYQGTLNYLFEYFLDKQITPVFSVTQNKFEPLKNLWNPVQIQISDDSFQSMIKFDAIKVNYFTALNTRVDHVIGEYIPPVLTSTTEIDDYIVYTKQLTSTVSCSITLKNLRQEFNVHDGHTTIVRLHHGFDDEIMSDVPNVDGVRLRLPLQKLYADKVSNKLQNELYHHALCFIFNSYQNVKVKWYQDAGWGYVIQIAAIIFALPSGGQSFTWASALTAALKFIVQNVIVRLTIKGLIKIFGIEVVTALLVLTSIYGYVGKDSLLKLPFADTILKMSTNMWSAYDAELQERAQDIQKEMEDLDAEMKKQEEELLTAKKLLDTGADDMNPALFVNPLPQHSFSEYPDQMIDRLLSGIRIPDIVVNAPSNYVDLMLTLPTFDETIRMNTRGK